MKDLFLQKANGKELFERKRMCNQQKVDLEKPFSGFIFDRVIKDLANSYQFINAERYDLSLKTFYPIFSNIFILGTQVMVVELQE